MIPVIALVGRPNVGKSTLFNRLTKSRDALVADQPGLTRDRKFGEGKMGERDYLVVDTGGLEGGEEGVEVLMANQAWLAVEQADIVLFIVDAREGLTGSDEEIAAKLRATGKPLFLVVNKIDGLHMEVATADFYALGIGEPHGITATHGRGVSALIDKVLATVPEITPDEATEEQTQGIKLAIVGRPNVGKSTLVNRMLGEERVVTFDLPGTTRDSIYLPFERDGQSYTLIDTAGVRRRRKVNVAIEKFSVIKTLRAIEDANVVIMLLDAQEGVSEQDATLLGFILDAGRALVIAVNKWDGLETYQREQVKRELDYKLPFLTFAQIHYISALHGSGVGNLFPSVTRAYESAMKKFTTPRLTRLLSTIVMKHQPPLVRGRRIKLRYAHQGGSNPPLIVIHGNQTHSLAKGYQRYLANAFMKQLQLEGTPLRFEFKTGENPFKDKRNPLTKRQQEKRRRLMRHVKGRK